MNGEFSLSYAERTTGRILTEQVFADHFLYWAYNSSLGWWVTGSILSSRWVSRIYGWYNRRRWSRLRIKSFAHAFTVDQNELTRPLEEYANFNDFFTREIDLSQRPISPDSNVCIAPVDGKVLAYPCLAPEQPFRIKRAVFNLHTFLGNTDLSFYFADGAMVVCRLALADYHHFHFPDDGIPHQATSISGRYHAGGPYPQRRLLPFYQENHRMITLFDSTHFGRIALIEVGALTVGSIRQCYRIGEPVVKGAHKGYFELGGSTVVMLFRKGTFEIDADLGENTQRDIETYVKMGASVGRATGGALQNHEETKDR
jgi:phosphatidylserine decarboxylase